MGEPGDLPTEAGARHLHILSQMQVAPRKLDRFVGHEHRGKAHARCLPEMPGDGTRVATGSKSPAMTTTRLFGT